MESDESLVLRFKLLVQRHWHHPLNAVTCIPREDRKLIRDIIRRYVQLAPAVDSINRSGRPLNLYFRKYVEKNPMYLKIFVNADWLEKHDKWMSENVEINQTSVASTLGRLYLLVVKKLITGQLADGKWTMDVDVTEKSSQKEIDARASLFCQDFLSSVGNIAVKNTNSAVYFGVPMYWWYGVDAKKIYETLEIEWTQNTNIVEDARYSLAFIQFMSEVNGTPVGGKDHVKVAFEKTHEFKFVMSVPEFVMDGLCFTAWDAYSKVGKSFTLDIFITPSEHDGAVYKSVDHDQQGNLEQLERPKTTDCSAVRISYYPDPVYEDSEENDLVKPGSYEIYYFEYGDPYNISRNYYERRDRLTYDGRCHQHHRVWTHPDEDGTTYLRMLWDRYDGDINVSPFVDQPPPADACVLPQHVDKLLKPLEDTITKTKACCENNMKAGKHLERHLETMRQYAVLVSNKTDVHTCHNSGANLTRHAIDGSFPPPHVTGNWRAHSDCGRRRTLPRTSHGDPAPWWWGRHGAIWQA
ncbi:A-type inclusion protein-like protein [Seal parapoxvirus]|uniref:A-type inclusion protein-like protein n=1 Tax=Seal parapoxvirus TaxID=187984 RepID=A0A1Z3GCR0_9POXV|nr:A-type inclusion protein-like protein [Seal parapoxvirus]ASC55545.1 A-type inclusion protein-like protein [Seal parapoxvirus]